MTNNSSNKKNVEKEAAEIKSIIKETQKDTCIFMLMVLDSLIREQVQIHNLDRDTGDYLIQAAKEQFKRKGWID